jgi:urocanate hydratase
MGSHHSDRRQFLTESAALAGLAVGAVFAGRTPACGYVAQRDRDEPDVTAVVAPVTWPGGIAGAMSLIGPTYRISDQTMEEFGRIVTAEARRVSEQLGELTPVTTDRPRLSGGTR